MKTVKFKTTKGTGISLANVIRSVVIESSSSCKVIAYSLQDQSIYRASANIVDPLSFVQKLTELRLVSGEMVSFPLMIKVDFTGNLTISDLNNSTTDIVFSGDDEILLDSISNDSATIYLVINKSSGYCNTSRNLEVLKESGIPTANYNVITSRSYDVEVSTSVVDTIGDYDEVTLKITSESEPEENRLLEAIDYLGRKLAEIKQNL